MSSVFHVLNGDALKEQFPNTIDGNQIIARECLVDGPVIGETLEDFFNNRAEFITTWYGDYTKSAYQNESADEIKKILDIPRGSAINLWFEDDLFCQVNFWFVCHLINQHLHSIQVFLVRPPELNQYGFGALNQEGLLNAFGQRTELHKIGELAELWTAYQKGELDQLVQLAEALKDIYPFLLPAVRAHIDRIPSHNDMGRPVKTLIAIMKELKTQAFGPIFQEFCKREAIYGFGDLQVKRLYDKIIENTQ